MGGSVCRALTWTGQPLPPFTLEAQSAACGLEPPTVADGGYHYLAGRLFAHTCRVKDCAPCAAARRLGWRTVRVTKEEIGNGVALDRVAGLLWLDAKSRQDSLQQPDLFA